MRSFVAIAAFVAAGCVVDIDFGETEFRCGEGGICPVGYECIVDRCVGPGGILDAAAVDALGIDAAIAPVIPTFGPPLPVADLSDPLANDDDAALTADQLLVVFNSDRGGVGDLWTSRRASVSSAWQAPIRETELSSTSTETGVGLSADGLTVVFGSARPGGAGGIDIHLSRRVTRDSAWSVPIALASINTAFIDLPTFISDDGELLVFESSRDGDVQIYAAQRISGDEYGVVAPISELNTAGENGGARLVGDGRVVVFSTNRDAPSGLFGATRALRSDVFSPPANLGDLTANAIEEDPWLSDDLCTLFFTAVDGSVANIYEASCE